MQNILYGIIKESITQDDLRNLIPLNTANGYKSIDGVISDIRDITEYFKLSTQVKNSTINKVKLVLADLEDAFQNVEILKNALDLKTPWDAIARLKETVSIILCSLVLHLLRTLVIGRQYVRLQLQGVLVPFLLLGMC